MKKALICTCTFLTLIANASYAQKEKNAIVENVTKVNFLLPGLAHEHALGKASTIYLAAYMNMWTSQSLSFFGNWSSTVHFSPALDVSFRNYYNYKRRSGRGLRTEMNSLNYIAPAYMVTAIKISSATSTDIVHQIGVVWGFQRNYPGRFSLDFNIGAGYFFNAKGFSNNQSFWPMSQLTLGIWLKKKKK